MIAKHLKTFHHLQRNPPFKSPNRGESSPDPPPRGEAYAEQGDTALAIRYYEKSLELNPENDNVAAMLEKLRAGGDG